MDIDIKTKNLVWCVVKIMSWAKITDKLSSLYIFCKSYFEMALGKGNQGGLGQITEAVPNSYLLFSDWHSIEKIPQCFVNATSRLTPPQWSSCYRERGPVLPRAQNCPKPSLLPWFQFWREIKRLKVIELCNIALTEQNYLFLIQSNKAIFRLQKYTYNSLGFIIRGSLIIKY